MTTEIKHIYWARAVSNIAEYAFGVFIILFIGQCTCCVDVLGLEKCERMTCKDTNCTEMEKTP